jgi:hypothetical protein
VLNLTHGLTDLIGSLTIAGVTLPAGIYDASTHPGVITGTGKLQVTTTASAYDTWIAGFPSIPIGSRGPGDDPDSDGSSNGVEFALGGIPNTGSNRPKIYSILGDSTADVDTLNEMLITIAVRSGTPVFTGSPSPSATQEGFTYTIEGSTNLNGFGTIVTPVAVVLPPAPDTTPPAGYEYRTFSLNGSNGLPAKGFLHVKINY